MVGALDGVRVVDLTQMATGPFATMQLADQGADVIKIEPPGLGDAMRAWIFWSRYGTSAMFAGLNRGKRSAVIDLNDERGREVLARLVADADVFVENFRPGVVRRMGLDPDDLRSANPNLITVSISGYGLEGEWSGRPVLDPVIQALTGHVALQVNPEVPFPDLIRHAVVDKVTGCYVAQAVTAALYRRSVDGHGQHIDLSMTDASLSYLWPDGMMAHALVGDDGVVAGPTLAELYSLTDCADGKIVYFSGTIAQRLGLYRAVGYPEWCDDDRYNTFEAIWAEEGRNAHLGQLIAEAFEAMPVAEAVDRLAANHVPGGPVLSADAVSDHPQIVANDSLVEIDDPVTGPIRHPRPPARFTATPSDPDYTTPAQGGHTDEVLSEAGLDDAAIAALRADGVVA